ncbi:type II toxin-antitoxin system HipA family toxin [Marinobacteraceae bacterium S3BR75-40.1]
MTKTNRIDKVTVVANDKHAGQLLKGPQFEFSYDGKATEDAAISLVMPVRKEAYRSNTLPPIFEMNIPEGYLRQRIFERFRKHYKVDEMFFLALQGDGGIGRLRYRSDLVTQRADGGVTLSELVESEQSQALFENLIERYITSTTIAGVQPKIVVPESADPGKAVINLPQLIVKAAGDEFPGLAINEFVCMSILQDAGLKTPEFYLSVDQQLFIMRRFDLTGDGVPMGMEDFCVLTNRSADDKYHSSYEQVAKAIRLFSSQPAQDLEDFFLSLSLSILLGNGDAHLKNFAVLYEAPGSPVRLSPWYDVVNTTVYQLNDPLALKLNKTKDYPHRGGMVGFGTAHCRLTQKKANELIELAISAVERGLEKYGDLIDQVRFADDFSDRTMRGEIEKGIERLKQPEKARVKIPGLKKPKRAR